MIIEFNRARTLESFRRVRWKLDLQDTIHVVMSKKVPRCGLLLGRAARNEAGLRYLEAIVQTLSQEIVLLPRWRLLTICAIRFGGRYGVGGGSLLRSRATSFTRSSNGALLLMLSEREVALEDLSALLAVEHDFAVGFLLGWALVDVPLLVDVRRALFQMADKGKRLICRVFVRRADLTRSHFSA